MPRGNLESIQPRIILLKEIIQLINDKEYGKSFRILRQNKLDINLIYDTNPDQFLANIDKFVAEVKQVDYLNLFVNSLNKSSRGEELEFMVPQAKEDLIKQEHDEFIKSFSYNQVT